MSVIGEIVTLLESKVASLLPSYKPMPFVYDIEGNDRLADKCYGIKVANANSIAGTNNAVTMEHNLEIALTQRYSPKKALGDKDLRDKIAAIGGDLETIYKELYRRPGALASATLLVIAPLDLSVPDIDNDNNIVTLTLTVSVKYRVPTI